MNLLSNILDTNQWLISLATHLAEVFTRSGLMISEDITFTDTLIESQKDFQLNNDLMKKSFNKHILLLFSLTSGLLWFESTLTSYRPLFGSVVVISSLKLSSVLYKLLNKMYLRHRLSHKAIELTKRVTKERLLMKKYFKLLEDNEVIENCVKQSLRITEMKDRFRSICWKCFLRFRDQTIYLRQSYALNPEMDDEINYLCCLPIQTFDKFTAEDNTVITLSALKSLIQLKRLQMSEFFRRIVCLFVTICLHFKPINKTNDKYFENICKQVIKTFDLLIRESDDSYSQLLSHYNCSKTLWISSETSLVNTRDLKRTQQTIEALNLLNTNRNIRKHLLIALNILDECDSVIEDGIKSTDFMTKFRQNFDSINTEFNCLNELMIVLQKYLRIEELKESKTKTSIIAVNKEDSVKHPITGPTVEDYVVRDQVFEAIVTEDSDENGLDLSEMDEEWCEYRLKLAKESNDSRNLFIELQTALKSKAAEHQRREAKALGIELDATIDSFIDASDNTRVDPVCDQQLSEANASIDSKQSTIKDKYIETKAESAINFTPNVLAFGFESQIACIAAEKGRLFGLNNQTESFGDQSDSDDNYEQ